jgi:RimJ/RimL family protein N-acetyltransferase
MTSKWSILVPLLLTCGLNDAFAADRGRLAHLIDQARREADCVVSLEGRRRPVETNESYAPPASIPLGALELREISPDDPTYVGRFLEILTDERVREASGDHLNEEQLRELLTLGRTMSDLGSRGLVNLAVVNAADRVVIGFAQVAKSDVEVPRTKGLATDRDHWREISYHLHPDYWRRGFGGTLVKGLVDHLFADLSIEGIYAQVESFNVASAAVLKKAGMVEIERRMFPSLHGTQGLFHHALTREQYLNPPLKHGFNLRTFEKDGHKMMSVIVKGEVPTWTVVRVDEATTAENYAIAQRDDRLIHLSRPAGDVPWNHGLYVSVPGNNFLGGPHYTSALALDDVILDNIEDGRIHRRGLAISFASLLGASMSKQKMFEDLAAEVPEGYATLSVFERRRVYEKLSSKMAEAPAMIPFQLFVLNADGVDLITRARIVPPKR